MDELEQKLLKGYIYWAISRVDHATSLIRTEGAYSPSVLGQLYVAYLEQFQRLLVEYMTFKHSGGVFDIEGELGHCHYLIKDLKVVITKAWDIKDWQTALCKICLSNLNDLLNHMKLEGYGHGRL